MTQHSEDRIEQADNAETPPRSARILPFERPQSELQRAIQLRAQEAMEIERDREREAKKPAPLRWLVIFLIALIPVVLIFGAVDGFLRAFYRVNEMYKSAPPAASEPAQSDQAPLTSSQPGVIILQPLGTPPADTPAAKDDAQASEPGAPRD